ncbi:unnamed protein product [Callosobruchus maculatus]|uniref:Uncharacterized protein n=1 Tax=Callosobruchus maculatus TaxID=64391 RepID=A0A653C4Z8_CALMS|nr:unnamed protein product [Callosobruchus maculatus]
MATLSKLIWVYPLKESNSDDACLQETMNNEPVAKRIEELIDSVMQRDGGGGDGPGGPGGPPRGAGGGGRGGRGGPGGGRFDRNGGGGQWEDRRGGHHGGGGQDVVVKQ